MDAEVANLERALEAVRARSMRALANEQLYHARIRELEQMNRALVVQLASLTGSDETRADAASARLAGAAEREGSSAEGSPARAHPARVASYKTLRTKTNRLSVERVDLDDGAGSDGVPDAPCSGGRLGDADGVGATNPRDSAAESGDSPATIERLASEFAGEVRLSASRGNNDGLGGFESRGGPTGDDPAARARSAPTRGSRPPPPATPGPTPSPPASIIIIRIIPRITLPLAANAGRSRRFRFSFSCVTTTGARFASLSTAPSARGSTASRIRSSRGSRLRGTSWW
jgi:hypothetical protein